jgi:choline dehydrogenase-like flavoprotein
VVDPWGKVWDTEGLYVADGSILPSSLGVNPQLTIMMAATRIAWRIAEENLSREPLAA